MLGLVFSMQYILSSQFSIVLCSLVDDADVSATHDLSIFHPTSANMVCFSETSITRHINQTTYNHNHKCHKINVSPHYDHIFDKLIKFGNYLIRDKGSVTVWRQKLNRIKLCKTDKLLMKITAHLLFRIPISVSCNVETNWGVMNAIRAYAN